MRQQPCASSRASSLHDAAVAALAQAAQGARWHACAPTACCPALQAGDRVRRLHAHEKYDPIVIAERRVENIEWQVDAGRHDHAARSRTEERRARRGRRVWARTIGGPRRAKTGWGGDESARRWPLRARPASPPAPTSIEVTSDRGRRAASDGYKVDVATGAHRREGSRARRRRHADRHRGRRAAARRSPASTSVRASSRRQDAAGRRPLDRRRAAASRSRACARAAIASSRSAAGRRRSASRAPPTTRSKARRVTVPRDQDVDRQARRRAADRPHHRHGRRRRRQAGPRCVRLRGARVRRRGRADARACATRGGATISPR